MLWTIATVLLALWLVGLASSYTMGGVIHVYLFVALLVLALGVTQGRMRAGGPPRAHR
jgi:hypothetical protein